MFSIKRRGFFLFLARPRRPGVNLNPAFIQDLAFIKMLYFSSFLMPNLFWFLIVFQFTKLIANIAQHN